MSRIRKLVENVHMGMGHDGLASYLKKRADIDVTKLGEGDLVMCMNGYGDKLKVIGHKGLVLGYLKMPHKQRIMKDALQFIPRTFGSSGFDYDSACKTVLEKRLGKLPEQKRGPLAAAKAIKEAGL